jgi:hypothetical protein
MVQMVIEDDKIDLTDLEEEMVAFKGDTVDEETGEVEDLIQSVDQLSMNKVSYARPHTCVWPCSLPCSLFPPPPAPPPTFPRKVRLNIICLPIHAKKS